MAVTCCPVAASHVFSAAAVLATMCGDYCGPDCHAYGITAGSAGGQCIVCKAPPETLSSCEDNYRELLAGSVTVPDHPTSSLCKGVTCHLCGTDLTLSGIPDGAHLYLTPTCAPFDGASVDDFPREMTLLSPPSTVIRGNLTIHLQDSDTLRLVGHPPTIIGNLTIVSKNARLLLDTDTSHCHLLVENGPVVIEPHISVTRGNCGISHFRATPPTAGSASADFTLSSGLTFENCTRHCYTGAISNIVGTVSIPRPKEEEGAEPPATILVIETTLPDAALTVLPPTRAFSVSKLLNVFGTDYEIEYACEAVTSHNIADCGDTIIDHSYEAVNRRLLPAALALIVIFLTNPSFGKKDE